MVVSRQLKNYGEGDKAGHEWGKAGKIDRYTYSFALSRTWVAPLHLLLPSRQWLGVTFLN